MFKPLCLSALQTFGVEADSVNVQTTYSDMCLGFSTVEGNMLCVIYNIVTYYNAFILTYIFVRLHMHRKLPPFYQQGKFPCCPWQRCLDGHHVFTKSQHIVNQLSLA